MAHGGLVCQTKLPSKWMDAVEKNGHGVQEMKLINPTERMEVRPLALHWLCAGYVNLTSCVVCRVPCVSCYLGGVAQRTPGA